MQTPGSILLHLDSSARTQERIALARQLARSLWATLRTPNRTLWAVLGLASALLLAALYVPWAVGVLRFAPLPAPLLDLHRAVKRVFDPAGILNPGRMYADL